MIKSTLVGISILLMVSCNTKSGDNSHKPIIDINTSKKDEKIKPNIDINSTIDDLLIVNLLVDDMYIYLISDKSVYLADKHSEKIKFIFDRSAIKGRFINKTIYGDYIYLMYNKEIKIHNKLNGALYKSFMLDIDIDYIGRITVDDNYLYIHAITGDDENLDSQIYVFNKYKGSLHKRIDMPKIQLLDYSIDDNYLYICPAYKDNTNILIYNKSTFSYDSNLSTGNRLRSCQIDDDNLYTLHQYSGRYNYYNLAIRTINTKNKTITSSKNLYSMRNINQLYMDDNYYYVSYRYSHMKIIDRSNNKVIRTVYTKGSTIIVENYLYFIDKNNHIQKMDISSNENILQDNNSKYFIKEVELKNELEDELRNELEHITTSSNGKYIAYYAEYADHVKHGKHSQYITVFNIDANKVIFKKNIYWDSSLAFTPDEEYLMYQDNHSIMGFNLNTKSNHVILPFKTNYIHIYLRGFAYNSVSSDSQKIIYLIRSKNNTEIVEKNMYTDLPAKTLNIVYNDYIHRAILSPNHKYAVYDSNDDNKTNLVNLEDGTTLKILNVKTSKQVIFHPNSQEIAILYFYENKIETYDIKGKLLKTIKNKELINSIIYSKDGQYLLSGNKDSTISIWDTNSGKLIGYLKGHANEVTFLSFDSNGRLISVDMNKAIRIWDFNSFIADYKEGKH